MKPQLGVGIGRGSEAPDRLGMVWMIFILLARMRSSKKISLFDFNSVLIVRILFGNEIKNPLPL